MQRIRASSDRQDKLRQIASLANAEPIGSLLFYVHTGLLFTAGLGIYLIFDAPQFIEIVGVYIVVLTAEKLLAGWVQRNERTNFYWPVLFVLFLRAMIFNSMVLVVWAVESDVFKMAAIALVVAATINIFVFHATHPNIITCVFTPIWLCFAGIAWGTYQEFGWGPDAAGVVLVFICITPYFYFALRYAYDQWQSFQAVQDALFQSQKRDALGKLVAGVAHDFNNILAVTLGTAELLKNAPEASREALVDQIITAAERGTSLSNQLLAFGKRSYLVPASHNVKTILSDFEAVLGRVLPNNIKLTITVAPDALYVFADRHQLESALLNLAINARDAMPVGGDLDIYADKLSRGSTGGDADQICIAIQDSGIGVPEDIQEQVFDPFFTTKSMSDGTGLGLSMVMGFAKQSSGTVTLQSEPGTGTRIEICLPSATEPPKETEADEFPIKQAVSAHVLLVEDEAALRAVNTQQLQRVGHNVLSVADGQQAEFLLKAGLRPDVLVTDIVVPGSVKGTRLAVSAREILPDLPVVILSGYRDEAVSGTVQLGSRVITLAKPATAEKLISAVARALRS